MKKKSKYRPREIKDPIQTAINRATCLTDQECDDLLGKFEQAAKNMLSDSRTQDDYVALTAGIRVSDAIEKSGIVRGLKSAIDDAMLTAERMATGAAASHDDEEALKWWLKLHRYQLKQLSRNELDTIVERLKAQERNGHENKVVPSSDTGRTIVNRMGCFAFL